MLGYRTGSTEAGPVDNVTVYTITSPTPTPAPGAPTALAAGVQWNAGKPLATLSWTAAASGGTPTGSLLERRVTGTPTYQRLTGLNAGATSFNDYWVQPNTGYDYRLSVFNATGSSGYATTHYPATLLLPLGYLAWAQSSSATSGSLAAGSLWTDIGASGVPNSMLYAFSGNPTLGNAPGELFVRRGSSGPMQVRGNSFSARTDTHYALQGSPDLATWQTYLDETGSSFAQIAGGAGTSAALLNVDATAASAPLFFRWSISPNASASATPAGMLVNGLPGTSGPTLTQPTPVFSWEVGNDAQTACEILVATSPSLLTEGAADVWSSSKVTGTASLNIPFSGLALQSNTTYYWTVRTWDDAGVVSAFAAVQSFTTGTLTTTYQTDQPKVVQESIAPVSVVPKGNEWYFVDFGNDAFGTIKLNIPSPVAGQVITVGIGELLIRPDGLYTGTMITGSGSAPTDIVDWPAGERDTYTMTDPVKTVTSAFYYQALIHMQQIATVLGKTSDASTYQSAAALTLGSLNSKLWDSTNLRFADGLTSSGTADTHASLHGNMFPLVFGMVPPAYQANVLSYIEGQGMVCSVYGAQYFLEALYSHGAGTYALSQFDSTAQRSWYNMINADATMTEEAWDQTLKTNEDWNHAWGAAAANIIPRWLMGVRPLTPGFQTFVIQPQPGTLSYASMTVPTIRGPVSVNVQTNTGTDFALSVNIPANTAANVGLPTLGSTSTTVAVDGVSSTGTISGNTIWINDVTPGPHLFERLP